ncbi:thiol reductant ABC exporter subunit CydD [Streptomyces sp. NPDC127108]|uniref:thiol reductant ABC exporter subunit CydD n=1 Tax=Streptomyces sp. NPDC127108 TaxID=3345361 RepID=UPI00362C688C
MKPVERRLIRELPLLRRHMKYATTTALLGAALTVAQAVLLATVLADGFAGRGLHAEPLAALGTVMALRALLTWARGTLAQRVAADVKRTLRDRITGRLRHADPLRLAARRHGETATLLTRGLDALDPYVVGYLPTMAATAVVPLTVVGWLAWTDWTSALIVVVTLPLIPVFGALVGMHTARRTARQWRLLARLGGHFLDVLAGLPTLRAFGRERHQARVVDEMADAHRRATMRTLRVAFLSSFVLETVATLSVALVAVPVGLRLLHGELDLRTALVVLFLAPEAYLPLRALGAAFHDSAEGVAVAERVFAVLDDQADAPTGRTARTPDARTAHLRLDDVTVHHPGRAAPALRHVCLAVRPGEHVALVGPSGAGKSTLLALLLGFVTPASGRVEVGGIDLGDLDADAWRAQVAWVPQRPHLFAASVADNIRLGRPGASDAEVRAAARAASADVFIEELAEAYDTVLGEQGAGLSAGQRQRVALARAFLKDAPVLLLDEPTAHLDPESEAAVTRATVGLMRGRTAVVVAHRTSLLPHADRIVTVRGGALGPPRATSGQVGTSASGDIPTPVPVPHLPCTERPMAL